MDKDSEFIRIEPKPTEPVDLIAGKQYFIVDQVYIDYLLDQQKQEILDKLTIEKENYPPDPQDEQSINYTDGWNGAVIELERRKKEIES